MELFAFRHPSELSLTYAISHGQLQRDAHGCSSARLSDRGIHPWGQFLIGEQFNDPFRR